jgi:hypothetical protein
MRGVDCLGARRLLDRLLVPPTVAALCWHTAIVLIPRAAYTKLLNRAEVETFGSDIVEFLSVTSRDRLCPVTGRCLPCRPSYA